MKKIESKILLKQKQQNLNILTAIFDRNKRHVVNRCKCVRKFVKFGLRNPRSHSLNCQSSAVNNLRSRSFAHIQNRLIQALPCSFFK